MKRVLLLPAAALVAVVACRDVTTQQNPRKTEPRAPAASASPEAAATQAQASTVCAAYRQQLGEAKAELARKPGDESLQQNVDTYQSIIADACN
ncbi:MAG TPA: hypothetical protein VF771_01990 [Longimicrobiaceae bacterium]